MIVTDVVLFNSCGCDIARETITDEKGYAEIISEWVIYPNDRIEFQEVWTEV